MARTLVYVVEGEPSVGTVADYASALEQAHYAGLDVAPTVWFVNDSGTLEPCTVHTSTSGYNEDDYAYMTVDVEIVRNDPETATIRIDGRA